MARQVFRFYILKALISIVINMLQKRLKIEITELYYGLYQNSWYLVKKSILEKY